jgi:drug/metabolite transporter (DMT)-like permease
MTPKLRDAYFMLHSSVFLWGFTAILGRMISVSALTLVWWRMLFTSISFIILLGGWRKLQTLERKDVLRMMGIGVLVALHWITFYGAIKLANASVALVALSTMSLFTSIISPLYNRTKIDKLEMGLGIIVIPAMILIINQLDFSMRLGLGVGIVSAAFSSSFTILNKSLIDKIPPLSMSFIELGSGWLFLTLFMPFFAFQADAHFLLDTRDLILIMILTLACTTLPYIMSLKALKEVNAFTISLSLNLEPVYGLIMAIFFLHEDRELTLGFYVGVVVLLATVIAYPLLKKRMDF